MKGNILFGVLSKLALGANLTLDTFRAIIWSPYGSSMGYLMREVEKRNQISYDLYREEQIKRRYYKFVYKLKKEGLVMKSASNGGFALTEKGRQKLERLKVGLAAKIMPKYKKTEDTKTFKIVAFDIPEEKRRERDWLRYTLGVLGFTLLQRSVWLGSIALPESFIDDLKSLGILEYVQIMAITKTGSIRELV